MLPVCAPVAVGANVTPTVHVPPPANELVQVLVAILNSALLLVTLSPEIAVVPAFRTVKVVAALVVPTATEPNPCVAGVSVIGTVPVPVKLAVCVPALSTTVRVPGPSARGAGSEGDSDGATPGDCYRGARGGRGKVSTGRYAGHGERDGAGISQGKRASRRAQAAHYGRAQGARRRRQRRGLGLSRRGDGGEENQEPKENEENASARFGNWQAARHRNLVSQQMCVPFQGS